MKLILFICFFNFINSNKIINYIKKQNYIRNVIEIESSGKKILFVKKRFHEKSNNFYNDRFFSLRGLYEYKYEDLVDMKAEIIGIILKVYTEDLIIKLDKGQYIKTTYFKGMRNKISSICFLDDLEKIKSEMIEKNISLDYTNFETNNSDIIYNNLQYVNKYHFDFNKLKNVEILDVIPYIIDDKKKFNFYLKCISNLNYVVYVCYNRNIGKNVDKVIEYSYKNISP